MPSRMQNGAKNVGQRDGPVRVVDGHKGEVGVLERLLGFCGTEFFKLGLGREALRKAFLIFRQTRANEASVDQRKAMAGHLFHRLLRSPSLIRHAIGGNHHPSTVISHATVNEDFLAWILLDQGEKFCKSSVFRK
jgi:hypothetical protein